MSLTVGEFDFNFLQTLKGPILRAQFWFAVTRYWGSSKMQINRFFANLKELWVLNLFIKLFIEIQTKSRRFCLELVKKSRQGALKVQSLIQNLNFPKESTGFHPGIKV